MVVACVLSAVLIDGKTKHPSIIKAMLVFTLLVRVTLNVTAIALTSTSRRYKYKVKRFVNERKAWWRSARLGPLLVSTTGSLFAVMLICYHRDITAVMLRFRPLSMCSLLRWREETTGLIFMLNLWQFCGTSVGF